MKRIRLFAAAIAITALALTGCSSKPKETEAPKETQAKETQAPETKAPETEAAVVETEAAVVETEAPAVVETEAAVVETEAPETEEVVVETEAPETEEVVEETEAPETEEAVETEAPETEEVIETEDEIGKEIVVTISETEFEDEEETEEFETEEETEEAIETEEEETEEAIETEEEETEEAIETEEEETEEAIETEEEETEEAIETEEEAVETEEEEVETEDAEAEADEDGVMSYFEYLDADTDTLVTIEAYVQGKQAWYENNKEVGTDTASIYAQDKNGGYFLYSVPCSKEDYEKLQEGTMIRFTGYKSEWAGEVEIVPDAMEPIEIIRGSIYIADPVDVTSVLGDEDELIEYMNQKVTFTGLTVEPAVDDEESAFVTTETEEETEAEDAPAFLYGWDGSGSDGDDLYFRASYDGETYTFVIESNLCGPDTDVYKAVKNLKVGDTIDMEGFLYWYEGAQPHITSVIVED